MKNNSNKLLVVMSIFMFVQPFFDAFVYFINKVANINIPFISFVRPLFAVVFFIFLLFKDRIPKKEKIISLIYLFVYGLYCIIHLLNIKNKFYDYSYGSLSSEVRYLADYAYFLIMIFNIRFLYKYSSKKDQNIFLRNFVYSVFIAELLYFISIITKTSPITYEFSTKLGLKGWSVSAHYFGHILTYSLPVIIFVMFEKNLGNKYIKYLAVLLCVIPCFYLIGTKTPFFASFLIIGFYVILLVIRTIKEKKIEFSFVFFALLFLAMIGTLKYTIGYDNFLNQLEVENNSYIKIEYKIIDVKKITKIVSEDKNNTYEKNPVIRTVLEYQNIRDSVFDNREIEITLNKYLRSISPIKDKLFGYGHDSLPQGMWVETDFHTLYYCFGLVGFLIVIGLPILYFAIKGIKCLFFVKHLNNSKLILGFGFGLSVIILYAVGYTLQFAQTLFYLVILLTIYEDEVRKLNEKEKRDYLFMINDMNVGGAEVGLVDVLNELSKNNKVDLVLLRKDGSLLEKIDKKVNVYAILDKSNSKIKNNILHLMYFMGGIFTKLVYDATIKCEYKAEIAYLEGYPAVFIANSTNENSTKVASIRVGLKKHKLSAEKIPFGKWHLKNAYKKMDNIYTVSKETTDEFIELYPKCKKKTQTIYTYFNKEEINKKAIGKMDFKYDNNFINFVAVGRFSEQKGYDRLVKAFASLKKEKKNIKLYFIGNNDTEYGNRIKKLISDYKLNDDIILCGVKDNPYPYIKNCSALVSSSFYEGYPRVINEALCLKTLCVGTKVTGTKEALDNNKGILVEDSIKGIYEGLKLVCDNKKIYEEYEKTLENFDGNKEQFFTSFNNLLDKKKNMIIYMPKISYGGMEKALVNLINYNKLADNYNLTLYLIYKGENNYLNLLPSNMNVKILWEYKWNALGKIISAIKLGFLYIYRLIIKEDIAISYSYQHPILNSITRLTSENNIVFIHNNLIEGTDKKVLNKYIKKCKYINFNKIVCVSNDAKEAFIKLFNRKENVYVLNNVIDGDYILEKANEIVDDLKFKDKTKYFVNIARHVDDHKKITRILNACERLNKEKIPYEVILIGDGKDHEMYKDIITSKKLKNVHLLGKKANPYKYLKNSSCLLLSSIREGYPVVFIESLVLNKPIVTTNVSDAKKDIDKKYGIVVDNNDDAIYKGMKEFLEKDFIIKNSFNYLEFNSKLKDEFIKIVEDL